MRWNKDSNHDEFLEEARRRFKSIYDSSWIGQGFPDLIVSKGPLFTLPIEVKSSKGKLTPAQVKWWSAFKGLGLISASPGDLQGISGMMDDIYYILRNISKPAKLDECRERAAKVNLKLKGIKKQNDSHIGRTTRGGEDDPSQSAGEQAARAWIGRNVLQGPEASRAAHGGNDIGD